MSDNFWLYVAIGVISSVIIKYVTRPTGKEIQPDNKGVVHLRMNKFYQIIGFIGLALGLAFLIFIPATADGISLNLIVLTSFLVLLFMGTGSYCMLFYRNHKIEFNNDSLTVTSLFGKEKILVWKTVNNIRFNALTGMVEISSSLQKVRVHQHLVGLESLIKKLESVSGRSAKELNISVLKKKLN